MPALSLSDIADRRYRLAGHQAADAGLVSRHASAGSRQEGPIQHRTGSPARDLDQRRLADPAQADAGDDRTGPPLHAWRRRATDRNRRRLYRRGAHRRRHRARSAWPDALYHCRGDLLRWPSAVYPPSGRARLPSWRNQNGYAPASWPERRSSATAANGFAALPSSRVSSINAMSPAPIAEPHATLPSAGQTRCSPISRTACSPPTEWSPPNICRATSAPSPGVSTDALSSKQSTSASPSRQRQPRQCPTASSNWLRLDGKRDRHYRTLDDPDYRTLDDPDYRGSKASRNRVETVPKTCKKSFCAERLFWHVQRWRRFSGFKAGGSPRRRRARASLRRSSRAAWPSYLSSARTSSLISLPTVPFTPRLAPRRRCGCPLA